MVIFLIFSFLLGNKRAISSTISDSLKSDSVKLYKNSFGLEFNPIFHAIDYKLNRQNIFPLPFEMYYKRKLYFIKNISFRAAFYFKKSTDDTLNYTMENYDIPDTLPVHDYEMNVRWPVKRGFETEFRCSGGFEIEPIKNFEKFKMGLMGYFEKDHYLFYSKYDRYYIDTTNFPYDVSTGFGFYNQRTDMRISKLGIVLFMNIEIPLNRKFGLHFIGSLLFHRSKYNLTSFRNYNPEIIYEEKFIGYNIMGHFSTGIHYYW